MKMSKRFLFGRKMPSLPLVSSDIELLRFVLSRYAFSLISSCSLD